jgi:hypothetical protein
VSDGIEAMALLTFRANATAWAASRFREQRKVLKDLAEAAYDDLLRAGQEWKLESPANIAVGRAASAAARAWMSSGRSSANAIVDIEESFVGLPLDAIEGFLGGVRENTPSVFEPSVEKAVSGSREYEAVDTNLHAADRPTADVHQPVPPKDPLGEVDPHAASDFTFAGAANGIWKAFLQGEKIHKALEGWAKARDALSPHVSEILSWLHKFISATDGSPPLPPHS